MKKEEIYEAAGKSCIICNSCRYCEGLCAVFPAMERKREFELNDIDYLANLCHQCSECFYDCQYAPPHEFNLAIPTQFAAVRKESYKKYAFPRVFGALFSANALITCLLFLVILFLGFTISGALNADNSASVGDFYYYIPEGVMITVFSIVAILITAAAAFSVKSFACAIGLKKVNSQAIIQTIKDVAKMRYLGGHESEGCTYPNEFRSNSRRFFHQATMYGFGICFLATFSAAIYSHILGIAAPYSFTQLPKFLGVIGGILLCVGVLGLLYLKIIADKNIIDKSSVSMDYALLLMLFVVGFSGFALMFLRESSALAALLYFHLSSVLTLFLMVPYSKFMHILYRFVALLKYNMDEQEA